MLFVKSDERAEIRIGQAVAIRADEPIVTDMLAESPHSPSGHGLEPGVHEADAPVELTPVEDPGPAVTQVDDEVALVRHDVPEIFLDHVPAVSAGDEEVTVPITGEERHEMPEDRPAADLHHRFRSGLRLFRQPGATTAGEDDDHHAFT
jgi:hypothetical protein